MASFNTPVRGLILTLGLNTALVSLAAIPVRADMTQSSCACFAFAADSKLFTMADAPEWLNQQIRVFLQNLGKTEE